MARNVSLKQLKIVASVIASLGVSLGLYGAFKADKLNMRSFSLFAATSSLLAGMTGYAALTFGEDIANGQIEDIVSSQKEALDKAKQLKENNNKLSVSLKDIQSKHDDLVISWNDLSGETEDLKSKSQNQVQLAKRYLNEHLKSIQGRLSSAVQTGIRQNNQNTQSSEEHKQHIHKTLTKRLVDLEADIKKWNGWIKDITEEDYLEVCIQILDEITSHKSKIAATSTRLNYHQYVPKGFLHKENALKLNEDYHSTVLEKINEYDSVAADNGEFLAAAGRDIELLKARLVEQNSLVEALSKPIIWKSALNQATQAGNRIISWCKDRGVHLDRSHYTGDKYEANLYFFTDRLDASQTIDVKALNEEAENLAQLTHCLEPIKFIYDYDSRLVVAHLVMLHREKDKHIKSTKDFLHSPDKLLSFVKNSYHVGLWGSTGQGKTTVIANIVGGMVKELGGAPTIRTTIPKMDDDTRNIFPAVNWLGIPNSIFGLLESALEIQYRIYVNEQAYLNNKSFPEFDPVVFFVDEINLIFSRWRKINEADLEDVLGRFEATLSGDRLIYFNQYLRTELENYKGEFAKRLLLFTWQTGRSLKVKSLISGQNLQPGTFGIMKADLDNCSYIALGSSAKACAKYKVNEFEEDKINQQRELIQKELEANPELKFVGLYCPSQGNAFFGVLPPPNYYQWNQELLISGKQNQVVNFYQNNERQTVTEQELDELDVSLDNLDTSLDMGRKNVQSRPGLDALSSKDWTSWKKLPKKFQNLQYEGCVQLWIEIPKKPDGTPHKTQAYEKVFGVKRSDDRKVVSDFIDWLEANFR